MSITSLSMTNSEIEVESSTMFVEYLTEGEELIKAFRRSVLEDFSALLMSEDFSDVNVLVQGIIFPVHRCVLVQRSDYFRLLFTGNYTEKQQDVIELKEISADDFKLCLSIVYGAISYSDMDVTKASRILDVSSYFQIGDVKEIVASFYQKNCNSQNVLQILEQSLYYSLNNVLARCIETIIDTPLEILENEDFSQLSADALKRILSLDSFYVSEIAIFKAVEKWLRCNPDVESKQAVLDLVRLDRISQDDMVEVIWPSDLYSPDKIMRSIAESKYHPNRSRRGRLSQVQG